MQTDLFERYMRWEWDFPGHFDRKVKNPAHYRDSSFLGAVYSVGTRQVRPLLPDPSLHPVEIVPGRALAAVSAFEMRDTDIDPYNEFVVVFLVSHGRRPLPMVHALQHATRGVFDVFVWYISVNTEIAQYGGRQLFGYPKSLTNISFREDAKGVGCSVDDDDGRVLSFSGRRIPSRKRQAVRVRTFSQKNGHLLASNMFWEYLEHGVSFRPSAARLDLNTAHPVGRELASIGLSRNPLMVQYSPKGRAVVFLPRNVEDD